MGHVRICTEFKVGTDYRTENDCVPTRMTMRLMSAESTEARMNIDTPLCLV